MVLSLILLYSAFLRLASAQSAVLSFTNVPNPVTDGSPQAITYRTNDTITPVSIILRQGLSTNLTTVYNLTNTATDGQYIWTPRTDLPNGDDYALEILQGDQVNYFGPFRVQGYLGPLTSSASSASATSSNNSSMTSGPAYGTGSTGTGSALPRNTTFVSPSLSATTASTTSTTTATSTTSAAAFVNFELSTGIALMAAFGAVLLH